MVEKKFKTWCQGDAYLTRFVDDFVCCFQYKRDAERLGRNLTYRMKKFGLELAPEKTRMMQFGRFARSNAMRFMIKATIIVLLQVFLPASSKEVAKDSIYKLKKPVILILNIKITGFLCIKIE